MAPKECPAMGIEAFRLSVTDIFVIGLDEVGHFVEKVFALLISFCAEHGKH